MSVYEEPVIKNNKDIQQQINLLQEQLKPNINPIIEKILPFPYDINKNILDKLHIQKLIHIYKTNLKKLMYNFIKNMTLHYYYDTYKKYDSFLDYEIRHKRFVNTFYYMNSFSWKKVLKYGNFINNNEISNLDSMSKYDITQLINHCNNIIWKFENCMCNLDSDNDMVINLSSLDKQQINYRTTQDIKIGNEKSVKIFKIFKSNGSINPKPYKEMLEYIKEYVLRKKLELENIIEEI
tara:strand:- start:11 stop:721 length:711 start_codon:yes stop_codon:yes gene_type:complete